MGPDAGLRVLGSLKKKKTKTARTSPFGGASGLFSCGSVCANWPTGCAVTLFSHGFLVVEGSLYRKRAVALGWAALRKV